MPTPIVERPFRFSLQEARADSRRPWVDLVKRVDDAGFDMLVTADHLDGCLAPLIPLAIAAEVSDRLRLGAMVLNNDFLHPALLARELATLDLLSDGRAELGIGAGTRAPRPCDRRAGRALGPPVPGMGRPLPGAAAATCRPHSQAATRGRADR